MSRQERLGDFALDHVLVGGERLGPMESWFDELGMTPDYGGVHGNGVTHNAVIGFDDGSYVELIAFFDPDGTAPRRNELLRAGVGPCGWAVEPTDVDVALDRLAAADVSTVGPETLSRERPDGERVAFDVVYVGPGEPGTSYPFLIRDRTPREYRIEPSASVAGSELMGVGRVVLGVPDLEDWSGAFRSAFDLPDPQTTRSESLDAELAWFPGSALVLAEPTAQDSPLGERVDRFGALPCAHLVETRDFEASAERASGGVTVERWFDSRVGWFPTDDAPFDGWIGVVEEAT